MERDSQTYRRNLWFLRGKIGGGNSWGVWNRHIHTAAFKMDNQQGPTVKHMELCPFGSLDGRGVWRRMETCICMADSLCCSPETITILLIGYTPKQKD